MSAKPLSPPPTDARPGKRPAAARRDRGGRLILRALLVLLVLLALLGSGHTLLWRWMAGQLEDGFAGWAAARRAQGWQLSYGPAVRGGWPFAATLTLPRFRLAGGAGTLPGGLEWQAEALELRLSPPRLDRLAIAAQGVQLLRLAGRDYPFAADRLVAMVPLERNVLPSEVSVEAVRLRAGTAAGGMELATATLSLRTRMSAAEGEPAVELSGTAERLQLPAGNPPVTWPLGPSIDRLGLELALTGPVPLGGADPAGRAAIWRDGGGTLEMRSLEWAWGPVAGVATATVALDEQMQPMGAGTLRLTGGAAAVDAAALAGLLAPRGALLARAALAFLERPPADGAAPQLEVPLTLENRQLSAARIPLLRLPAWEWPTRPAPPPTPDAANDPSLPSAD